MPSTALYLDLLKKSLPDTLFRREPNPDEDQKRFIPDFARHYIEGAAITMLPTARVDNLQFCVEDVLGEGIPGDLIETGVWRGGEFRVEQDIHDPLIRVDSKCHYWQRSTGPAHLR